MESFKSKESVNTWLSFF